MKIPVVSIIVSIYNIESFLPECIGSLINQTYQHLQIILINDGSTDNSLFILMDSVITDIFSVCYFI
jgi:glycosyltransferase involved in cell wall biosynthesis